MTDDIRPDQMPEILTPGQGVPASPVNVPQVFSVLSSTEDLIVLLIQAELAAAGGHVRFLAPLTHDQAETLERSLREWREMTTAR